MAIRLGRALRNTLGFVGDVTKHAAPLAMMVPVVGPLGAAALGAAGGALGTINDKNEDGTYRDLSFGRALKHGAGYGAANAVGAYTMGGSVKELGRAAGNSSLGQSLIKSGAGQTLGMRAPVSTGASLAGAPLSSYRPSADLAPKPLNLTGGAAPSLTGAPMAAPALPAAYSGGRAASLATEPVAKAAGLSVADKLALGSVGAQTYGAHEAGEAEEKRVKMEQRLMDSRLRDEEEERKRREEAAPYVTDIVKMLMDQIHNPAMFRGDR